MTAAAGIRAPAVVFDWDTNRFFHGSIRVGRRVSGEAAVCVRGACQDSAVVGESPEPRHLEDDAMDKKAKTPKKPKQTKTKDGAAKGK